jgi:hypothetical protein
MEETVVSPENGDGPGVPNNRARQASSQFGWTNSLHASSRRF